MVILHSVLHDGQAKAGAARLLGMTLIYTIETLKHLVLMFGRNTDAGIDNADLDGTLLLGNRNLYMPARIVIFNGIVAKVVNDLIQQSADTIDNTIIAGNFQRNICYLYVLMIFSATSRLEMRSSMDCFSM